MKDVITKLNIFWDKFYINVGLRIKFFYFEFDR